jgi:alanine racemase
MTRPARALVDIAALKHNLQRARQLHPDRKIMAVVKANGYGHGIAAVSDALSGADGFGVASIDEALVLRDHGVTAPITVLEGFFDGAELPYFRSHDLQAVVHSGWQLELLERTKLDGKVDIWLKVDTGMNRLGFALDDIEVAIRRVSSSDYAGEIGLMSHLACADEPGSEATREQIARFRALASQHRFTTSLANSAGVVGWPDSAFDWQRPGIMLYGSSPVAGQSAQELDLQPAMTVKSALIAVNQRRKGDAVGYGGEWVCPEDMAVGVVAFGYGDGYPRHARSGTPVLVNGKLVPLIGRVSMDMITLDLRNQPSAQAGDEVILWGEGLPIDDVARDAGTISYELICHVTERVLRVIVDEAC